MNEAGDTLSAGALGATRPTGREWRVPSGLWLLAWVDYLGHGSRESGVGWRGVASFQARYRPWLIRQV